MSRGGLEDICALLRGRLSRWCVRRCQAYLAHCAPRFLAPEQLQQPFYFGKGSDLLGQLVSGGITVPPAQLWLTPNVRSSDGSETRVSVARAWRIIRGNQHLPIMNFYSPANRG